MEHKFINIDSFGDIICYNLITGTMPPKLCFPCFVKMKIGPSLAYILNYKSTTVNQIGWNVANLLPDSYSQKPCLQIGIPFFVFEV